MASGHLLANTFHALLTNPGARWSQSTVPRGIREIGENADYLAHIDETIDKLFKAADLGYPVAATEFFIDYVFFGTAGMYTAQIPGRGPVHHSRPLGELVIDEGADGRVNTVFRDYQLDARQFIEEFGEKADPDITAEVQTHPNRIIELIHLIHPRREIKHGKLMKGRKFRSVHIVKRNSRVVRESGSSSDPWAIARWMKDSGELYGRGPGWQALPDSQSASEMSRIMLETGQQHLQPPLLVPSSGILTQIDTSPGALVIYNANLLDDNGVRRFPTGDGTPLSLETLQDRRKQIQERFYSHLLQLFDTPGQTATASVEMETKAARILVSIITRAAAEFASPLLARTFDVANRQGMFDDPPDTLEGVPIGIEYLSPIIRHQRQQETKATLNTMAAAAQIAAATGDTAIFDVFDTDKEIREIALAEGMNMSQLRNKDEVEVLREFRARQEEELQKMEQMSQTAEAISRIGPTLVGVGRNDNEAASQEQAAVAA